MKHSLFLLLVVVCAVCQFRCTSSDECAWLIRPSGRVISFGLPPKASTFTNCMRYRSGKLYYYDMYSKAVLVYSLADGTLEHVLEMPEDPPHRIGSLSGFTVWSADTLVVAPKWAPELVLMDRDGRPFYRLPLKEENSGSGQSIVMGEVVLRSFRGMDVFEDKGEAVIIQQPYFLMHLPGKIEEEDMARYRMFYLYDLSAAEGRFSSFGLPKNYFQKGKVPALFSVIRMGDKYVFGCSVESALYWTRDFEEFESVPYQSRYFPQRYPTYNPRDPDPFGDMIRRSEYLWFYYDPWRRVAYRLARLSVSPELLREAAGDKRHVYRHPPDWVLQVFSEDLELLCERRFVGHDYSATNAFVAPEGLYVSISNPMRADYSEDSLRFELFELSVAE